MGTVPPGKGQVARPKERGWLRGVAAARFELVLNQSGGMGQMGEITGGAVPGGGQVSRLENAGRSCKKELLAGRMSLTGM